MKVLALVSVLIVSLFATSCHDRRPKAPKSSAPSPVCEKRTAQACLSLARELEEQGNSRYLEAYEAACVMKDAEACDRVLAEVELTVMATPTPAHMETWKHRLVSLCSAGLPRACVFQDLLTFSETPMDASAMKKAYFRLQESCRQNSGRQNSGRQNSGRQNSGRQNSGRQNSGRQNSESANADGAQDQPCVYLVQALNLVSRKNSAFYKANALTGFQTACLGGVGEACLADPLLQREKRDLEWTMSYLLKACELGETAGCDQLVAESKKAILEGLPRWKLAAGSLKTACYDVENRSACLMFALGHVRGWWEGSDPEIGRAEHLRQCRLGSDTACIEFASRLLETAPDQREWALQILRQACSESQPLACVHLAQALRRPGTPDAAAADRAAVDVLRVACYGQGGSQPQYYSEYDYDRSSYTSTYNNPACAVLGIFLLEGIGLEANEAVGFRLLSSGCAGMAGTSCVQYGEYMKKKGQVTASVITPVYERICMDTHEEGCFALAELKRTGYKELKPSEAEAKKYQAIGCRLAPAHPSCKNVK